MKYWGSFLKYMYVYHIQSNNKSIYFFKCFQQFVIYKLVHHITFMYNRFIVYDIPDYISVICSSAISPFQYNGASLPGFVLCNVV